jgi:membrane protein YqaA with SNARE-associated domain
VLPIDVADTRELLNAVVTAVSVLGGAMAYMSGYFASRAMSENQPSDVLGQRVNEALGRGFDLGWPAAMAALIIGVWA